MATTFPTQVNGFRFAAIASRSQREAAAHLTDIAVFISLLALIALVAIPYGTVEPWWIAVYEVAVFTLAALWILEGSLTGSWHRHAKGKEQRAKSKRNPLRALLLALRPLPLLAPLLLLVIFAFVQTIPLTQGSGTWKALSVDPFETRLVAWKILALVLNGIFLVHYTSSQRRLHLLVHVVIGVALASALFGIVRQTTQGTSSGFLLPYLHPNAGYAQFINKNHFALMMEMALGLICGLMIGKAVPRQRLPMYVAAAFLMWTALVLTTSRGGIFSMICQVVFMIATSWFVLARTPNREPSQTVRPLRRDLIGSVVLRGVLIAALLASVGIGIVWMGGDVLVTRLKSLPDDVGATSAPAHSGVRRMEIWRATWKLSNAHLVIGNGFGAYGVAITRYHDASGKFTPEAAHNDYLELLASGGLIGIAIALWCLTTFLKRARECLRSLDRFHRAASFGALTGLFGVMVHSVVDFGLHVTSNALFFTVLIAIVAISNNGNHTTYKLRSA
jgi:O-antigen ligase